MKPHHLWLTDAVQLLTFFLIGPAVGAVIAYKAWREREHSLNVKQNGMRCFTSGGAALLLIGLAKWIDADVRTPLYFLQLTCMLLGFLLLGASTGCGVSLFLGIWRWHKTTRLN